MADTLSCWATQDGVGKEAVFYDEWVGMGTRQLGRLEGACRIEWIGEEGNIGNWVGWGEGRKTMQLGGLGKAQKEVEQERKKEWAVGPFPLESTQIPLFVLV